MLMDDARAMSRNESPPAGLWAIALVALAPFPVSALVYAYGPSAADSPALTVLLTWSAVVLSFLGGVRWGMETGLPTPRWGRQIISALSGIAAWGLLIARDRIPVTWILGGGVAAFLVQWLFDHQGPDVPARYPKLSTAVTAAACVSLALCLDRAIRV
jgi:hypothetical protein